MVVFMPFPFNSVVFGLASYNDPWWEPFSTSFGIHTSYDSANTKNHPHTNGGP